MNKKVFSCLLSIILSFFLINKFMLNGLISIILFVIFYLINIYTLKNINNKYNKLTIILSIFLSIIYVICDSVEKTYFINIFDKYLLLNLSGYFLVFYLSLINLFNFIDKTKKCIPREIDFH